MAGQRAAAIAHANITRKEYRKWEPPRTSGNTVTLGGHVRTWAEHDAVVGATWMAPGVLQVRDYLDVTG